MSEIARDSLRLLAQPPIAFSEDDVLHLKDSELARYRELDQATKRIQGELKKLRVTALFRKYLKGDHLEQYDRLVAEKHEILRRLATAPAQANEENDPNVLRLRQIGHELNNLAAIAYLQSLQLEKGGSNPPRAA